jgi:hypothetical protein
MEEQDPVCIGCHRSIEEGSVVAFGEGLWHVQWQVDINSNFSSKITLLYFIVFYVVCACVERKNASGLLRQ